ncbi:transcription initiation factor IIF, beta subunit [Globomyces pollinis-pini]|nr:transcription initiation factor IIF, beta subunit [Globomyces pollinis-pini]
MDIPDNLSDSSDEDPIGIESKDTKVWLVKIPKFLADKWSSVQERGVELGKMRIYNNTSVDQKSGSKVTVYVPTNPLDPIPVPKNYNLTLTNMQPKNEFIFTESSQGKALELAGTVIHEATVGPVIDEDYRNIMKQRTQSSSADSSTRVVKVLSGKEVKGQGFVATSSKAWDAGARFTKRRGTVDKKERIPKSDLLDIIFKAFEEKSHYTLRSISDKCQQPHAWLKEVLNEVCTLNKKGPYNGLYELKKEFLQSSNEPLSNVPDIKMEPQ